MASLINLVQERLALTGSPGETGGTDEGSRFSELRTQNFELLIGPACVKPDA